MIEVLLAGATHDEQVSGLQHPCSAAPATARPHTKWTGISQRDDGHDWLLCPAFDSVAMPCDAVGAVAIEVQTCRVELDAVALRQLHEHAQHRWLNQIG